MHQFQRPARRETKCAAFDSYLISFDDNLRLMLSPRLTRELAQQVIADNFGAYSGEPLHIAPDGVSPNLSFLAKHRAVFDRRSKM
jgi:hypothetical protein